MIRLSAITYNNRKHVIEERYSWVCENYETM